MPWLLLILAGIFEVAWAVGLKYSHGFTRLWPSLGTVVAMAISFGLLAAAMKSLPMGTAYAVWVGVGAVGTVILGVVLFGEPLGFMRAACIGLIVLGLVGLKLSAG
jgi:quaternary ammonium compound-resistance protein SugE